MIRARVTRKSLFMIIMVNKFEFTFDLRNRYSVPAHVSKRSYISLLYVYIPYKAKVKDGGVQVRSPVRVVFTRTITFSLCVYVCACVCVYTYTRRSNIYIYIYIIRRFCTTFVCYISRIRKIFVQ